ncbi:MAG: dihydroorotate dehydrogenase [Syntrophaceae bacterium]
MLKNRLEVEVCPGLVLKNPVMTASGTFGYGREFENYVDLDRLGAIVVKGISLEPMSGNPPPRTIETAGGMLNAIGLQNVGLKSFLSDKLPYLREIDTRIIVNILGETADEYREIAGVLDAAEGVDALEVNISCPNVSKGGISFGSDPEEAFKITGAVKSSTSLPVIIKLTPNVTDIVSIARAVREAGADCVSLINTLKGMAIDIEKRAPSLRNVTGGLSGPAIKPVALRMVWEVAREVSVPVIGIGGIMSHTDALEFMIAGARAVQVGTANFVNPAATMEIIEGLEKYAEEKGIQSIGDLIGSLSTGGK